MAETEPQQPSDTGNDRTHDDDVRHFIEHFALVMTDSGMARMPARVFACVLTEHTGCLTARELSERLQVSPAAISGAVRYLVDLGVLHRQRLPGERVDHYCFGDDQWYDLYTTRDSLLKRWEDAAAGGAELLGHQTPAGKRLAESEEFFRFLREELASLGDRWHERRAKLFPPDPTSRQRTR